MVSLSIIIPVYNTEKYLAKCLDSVVNQSYREIEIIVVDDCSLENCEEIVKEYQEKDKRIIYIKHEENKGLFMARKTGVKRASGEYILHLDSDDWLGKNLCYKVVPLLEENPDLVLFDTISIREQGQEKAVWTNKGAKNYYNHTLFSALCDRSFSSWATCGKILKKELALTVYTKLSIQVSLIMAEDLLFFFYYAYFCEKALYVPYSGYYYNLTNTSVNRMEYTLEKAQNHLKNLDIVLKKFILFVEEHHITTTMYTPIIQELAQSFFIKLKEMTKNDKKQIFSLLVDTFGEEILLEYISLQAQFQDDKIRVNVDKLLTKILPKNSKRYSILRAFLMKAHTIINRGK